MATMIRSSIALALQILYLVLVTNGFAQVDPEKILVGTWNGQISANVSGNGQRTLVIHSIQKISETEWLARGSFNQPDLLDKKGPGQEITVISKDNDIILDWITEQGRSPIRLKLVDDNKLEGTINMTEHGQKRPSDKRLTLEKAAAK